MEEPRVRRRPARPNTPLVRAVLEKLEAAELAWAPRFLDLHDGHETLSWLPGEPVGSWRTKPGRLDDLARIVRQLHDLTADIVEAGACAVHDDLQPRNVVVDGDVLGLIDWEQLRSGRRVDDVAQLCWSFAGPFPGESLADVAVRWRRVLDAYGLDERDEIVGIAVAKIQRCIDDIERGASKGSARHELLRERGDHLELRATLDWLVQHGDALSVKMTK